MEIEGRPYRTKDMVMVPEFEVPKTADTDDVNINISTEGQTLWFRATRPGILVADLELMGELTQNTLEYDIYDEEGVGQYTTPIVDNHVKFDRPLLVGSKLCIKKPAGADVMFLFGVLR